MLVHAAPVQSGSPFLAADVGGTHVRVGLVEAPTAMSSPRVLAYAKYRGSDHAGLAQILDEFRSRLGHGAQARVAVVASAGYALADGSVIAATLPWSLSTRQVREQLQLDAVHLVNDFEAVAHAVGHLGDSEVMRLCGPAVAQPGPVLVLGPGTGLGAAVRIATGGRAMVLATEAGQAALAVSTELEMALLRQMRVSRTHVPVEHALSGPGLLNIYTALCALRGSTPRHQDPGAVTAAALDGSDPDAAECVDIFCRLLGSTVGDLALTFGARAVYLAGGILPHLQRSLSSGGFVSRFLDKGPMREALERVAVSVVEHGQLGVIGAASWYLQSDFAEA